MHTNLDELIDLAGVSRRRFSRLIGIADWTLRRWAAGRPISHMARPVATALISDLMSRARALGVPETQIPRLTISPQGIIVVEETDHVSTDHPGTGHPVPARREAGRGRRAVLAGCAPAARAAGLARGRDATDRKTRS